MNHSNRQSTDAQRGIFVSTHVPWGRLRDLHGVHQRAQLMMQACLDAWGSVSIVLFDLSQRIRSPREIEEMTDWLGSRLSGDFSIYVLPLSVRRPAFFPDWLLRYLSPWPMPAPSAESLSHFRRSIEQDHAVHVFCHRIEAFRIVLDGIEGAKPAPALFFDLDDIEHRTFMRRLNDSPRYATKFLMNLHTVRYWLLEQKALARCARTLVCSEVDADLLRKRVNDAVVDVVPNTVGDPGPDSRRDSLQKPPVVVFVGVLGYGPNLFGMNWFLKSIWPQVLDKHPNARLNVAGKGSELLQIPGPVRHSIELLGFVDDLTALYRQATLAICPIRSGGGTRIKLIEACAHGLASVSTRLGAEGLLLNEGESILMRDEPGEFAQAVIDLIEDRPKAAQMGESARRVFEQHYERTAVIRHAADLLRSIPDRRVSALPVE